MLLSADLKRMALGVLVGGSLGFAYQKIIGCRTGACPLTATPLRAATYGAVMGLIFSLTGCSKADPKNHDKPLSKDAAMSTISNVIHLTSGAFDRVKGQSKPVLIDFWAPWCGPCRSQGPILDELSGRIGDRAIVAKVNVDEEPALAAPFGVQAIPTLVILKGGQVVQRFTGLQQAETLMRALEAAGA